MPKGPLAVNCWSVRASNFDSQERRLFSISVEVLVSMNQETGGNGGMVSVGFFWEVINNGIIFCDVAMV